MKNIHFWGLGLTFIICLIGCSEPEPNEKKPLLTFDLTTYEYEVSDDSATTTEIIEEIPVTPISEYLDSVPDVHPIGPGGEKGPIKSTLKAGQGLAFESLEANCLGAFIGIYQLSYLETIELLIELLEDESIAYENGEGYLEFVNKEGVTLRFYPGANGDELIFVCVCDASYFDEIFDFSP